MKHLLFPLLFCVGCSGALVKPEPTRVRSYELGQTQEATTGSPMVRVARAYALPTFTPDQVVEAPPFKIYGEPQEQQPPPTQPGERWVAGKRYSDGGYLLTNAARVREEKTPSIRVRSDGSVSRWVDVGWQDAWPDGARFVPHDAPQVVEGSFEAELVYSGKSGDTIKLVYREYLDGLARPAFTQDLEYDLSESTTIGFKTLVIDVVEATNSSIRFIVQSDGGLPWLG